MWNHKTATPGFSLVELILTLAIVSLLAAAVGVFALGWQARTYASYSEAQLENDFRYALHVIAYRLRSGEQLVVSNLGGTRGKIYFPAASSIEFGHNSYQATLWIKQNTFPLCSHVAGFEIDISQLPLVTLKVTSVDSIPGIERGLPFTLTQQVRLRNYRG